ncbi:MAG: class I SAM-dependent methyltransferase [Clostridia bacterium]|nr:class I SAM-dependent methyltransferase [Clostridia bacterium]
MITNKNIDGGKPFDWGLASHDYAKYRDIYPEEFYRRIIALGHCTAGQTVLDLGTGTGVLPRSMYQYGAKFIGTDISENQIAYAKKRSKGLDIDYYVSAAEDLTFPNASFDVITACQCFMYFDKSRLLPKLHSFLKPGGHFLILYMAWLPAESEIAKTSETLVLKYNPSWSGGGMTRYTLDTPDWLNGRFAVANAVTYDIDVPFTREQWNGRMKACRGIDASLPQETIAAFERAHLQYLATVPPAFTIPHYASILDLKKI